MNAALFVSVYVDTLLPQVLTSGVEKAHLRVHKRVDDCPHDPKEGRRVADAYAADPQRERTLQAFHGQLRVL